MPFHNENVQRDLVGCPEKHRRDGPSRFRERAPLLSLTLFQAVRLARPTAPRRTNVGGRLAGRAHHARGLITYLGKADRGGGPAFRYAELKNDIGRFPTITRRDRTASRTHIRTRRTMVGCEGRLEASARIRSAGRRNGGFVGSRFAPPKNSR